MNIEESIKSESHLSNFNKSNYQEDLKLNKNETSYLKANLTHIEPYNSNNLINLAKDKENEFVNYINKKGYLTFENLEIVIIEKEVLDRMHFFEFLKIDEESINKVILNFKASAQTGSFFIYENLKKRIVNLKTVNNFQPFITVKIDKLKLALTSDINISNKGNFFV